MYMLEKTVLSFVENEGRCERKSERAVAFLSSYMQISLLYSVMY